MAAKHTPGPWFIFGNGHCVGGANTDATTLNEHPTAGIAMCGMARRDPAECTANARLIAAAPDLLEALQAAYDALGISYPLHSSDMDKRGAVLAQARAAIAKATGEGA